jgi:hypothetical protein
MPAIATHDRPATRGDTEVTNVTSLDDRRRPRPDPVDLAATADWLRAADAEIRRVSASPNELLDRLLDTGCVVTFSGPSSATVARVTLPDGSKVEGTGSAVSDALVDAYATGAYLADLPAVIAATVAHPEEAS